MRSTAARLNAALTIRTTFTPGIIFACRFHLTPKGSRVEFLHCLAAAKIDNPFSLARLLVSTLGLILGPIGDVDAQGISIPQQLQAAIKVEASRDGCS